MPTKAELILQGIQVLVAAAPSITGFVLHLTNSDGTTTVLQFLDSAEQGAEANNKQIADWLAANPPK